MVVAGEASLCRAWCEGEGAGHGLRQVPAEACVLARDRVMADMKPHYAPWAEDPLEDEDPELAVDIPDMSLEEIHAMGRLLLKAYGPEKPVKDAVGRWEEAKHPRVPEGHGGAGQFGTTGSSREE